MSDKNNESALSKQEPGPVIRAGEKRKAGEVTKQKISLTGKRQHTICCRCDNTICNTSANSNLGKINLETDHVVNVDEDQESSRGDEKTKEIENAQCSEQTKSECPGSQEKIDPTTEIINLKRENKLLKEKEEQQQRIINVLRLQLHNLVSGLTTQMLERQSNNPIGNNVLPIVCRYVDLSTLLACRLISQEWRDGVDSFLENCFSYGPFNRHFNFNTKLQDQNQNKTLHSNTSALEKLEDRYVFTRAALLETFFQETKGIKENPFLGRAITFRKLDRGLSNAYWLAAQKSLSIYGTHLHILKLVDFRSRNTLFVSFYQIFETFFPYLTNLKDLVIISNIRVSSRPEDKRQMIHAELLKYMKEKPLKTLPNLESLEFMCEIVEIQHAIIRACPAVKRFASGKFTAQTGILLKNRSLKEVHVKAGVWKLNWHHQAFQGLIQLNQNLEMLSITTKRLDKIHIEEVFPILSLFPKLSTLELDTNIRFEKQEANYVYHCMNMQNLTVQTLFVQPCPKMENTEQHTTEPFYAKLFAYFPNVKMLHIKEIPTLPDLIPWNGGIDPSLTYPLAKHDAVESLYHSEIWDLLKFLESVRMEVETCAFDKKETIVRTQTWTRKGLEDFKNILQE